MTMPHLVEDTAPVAVALPKAKAGNLWLVAPGVLWMVLFLVLQKYFVRALTEGAVKH